MAIKQEYFSIFSHKYNKFSSKEIQISFFKRIAFALRSVISFSFIPLYIIYTSFEIRKETHESAKVCFQKYVSHYLSLCGMQIRGQSVLTSILPEVCWEIKYAFNESEEGIYLWQITLRNVVESNLMIWECIEIFYGSCFVRWLYYEHWIGIS